MICNMTNECSQPVSPTPTPTPSPSPRATPEHRPSDWIVRSNTPLIVADSIFLVLILLVLGTFIYCCCSKKRGEASRTHSLLQQEDNSSRAEGDQTIDTSTSGRYHLNQSSKSKSSSEVSRLVESHECGHEGPERSDFGED